MSRPILRDEDVVQHLDKDPAGEKEEYIRAFSWFPNSAVPTMLKPLLDGYLVLTRKVLRDPRDAIFVTHIFCAMATVIPSGVFLLYSFSITNLVLHALIVGVQATPFVLMLHCVSHRPLFKKPWAVADGLVFYVLAPFFGQTWNSFYCNNSF
jgi:hypothetical protein